MSTELQHRTHDLEPTQRLGFLPTAHETERIWKLATTISDTDFVPRSIRGNKPAILAAMLTGRELGILPMRALRQVNIIDGSPTPAPELMMAMALKAGHDVFIAETSRERCVVEVRRADWPEDRVARLTWELEDAVAAGLCTLDEDGRPRARSRNGTPLPWEAYTRAMLRSRAVSEACRAWLPDVVEGASYAPEELGAAVTPEGHAQELADAAESRGEDYDPLDGEPAEVRAQVAEAMGEEPTVDPDTGEEIVDAEEVDPDDEGEEGPRGGDAEPEPPVRPDAPSAPATPEPAREEPDTDAAFDGPEVTQEEPPTPEAGDASPSSPAPEPETVANDEPPAPDVDLEDVPDRRQDEGAYAAWLSAAVDAYATLNVGQAAELIRNGHVDLEDGRRLAVPGGEAGLRLIARFEEHSPGAFRKTIRAALESAGLPRETTVPGTPAVPEPTPGQDGPADEMEVRRNLLRRWKAAHREIAGVSEALANTKLAERMEAGVGDDAAWRTAELATLEALVAELEERRNAVVEF